MISKWINAALFVICAYVAFHFFRTSAAGDENIGRTLSSYSFQDLAGQNVSPGEQNRIYLFWATWCGPCHAQLTLLNTAVKNDLIEPHQVYPISIGEAPNTVRSFAKEKNYEFDLYVDPSGDVQAHLDILATPSMAFVDEQNQVAKFTTGIAPIAIARASKFLDSE